MSWAARALAALLLLVSAVAAEDGDFDFYVLALSWSPTWCATAPSADESAQCSKGAGFGFVVHGLWPQRETGYPQFCKAAGALPAALVNSVLDIMPDAGLVEHEWRKHGICGGMPPEGYFAALRAAFETVNMPLELEDVAEDRTVSPLAMEAAFIAANPDLPAEGIAIVCDDGWLEEVRICLERSFVFRPCREVDMRGCRQSNVRLPAPD